MQPMLLLLLLSPPSTSGEKITIQNTAPRRDTSGSIMDAHDGKLIRVNGTYYLYGTTVRSDDKIAAASPRVRMTIATLACTCAVRVAPGSRRGSHHTYRNTSAHRPAH